MATSEYQLDFDLRKDPAANSPGFTADVVSAAGATTNGKKPQWDTLDFDQTSDEQSMWDWFGASNYLSGLTVVLKWYATPTSGNVIWKASVAVCVDGTTDLDTSSAMNTVDLSTAQAVPGTSGVLKQTSIALTSPGMAADRFAVVMIGRDADNGSDTAAGDARLVAAKLVWTS